MNRKKLVAVLAGFMAVLMVLGIVAMGVPYLNWYTISPRLYSCGEVF